MGKRAHLWLLACVAAAVVAGAAAGIAFATDSSGGGTLAACAKTETGQLRLATADGCLASEQAVQLGTAAASRADERYYVAPNLRDISTFLPLGTSAAAATRVVTMHVPAGQYAVASQITFTNHTGDGSVVCLLLDAAGHTHGYAQASAGIDAGFNRDETMTIDGALPLAADTDLSLACWSIPFPDSEPGAALVRAADITTKSVDAATITQETH